MLFFAASILPNAFNLEHGIISIRNLSFETKFLPRTVETQEEHTLFCALASLKALSVGNDRIKASMIQDDVTVDVVGHVVG